MVKCNSNCIFPGIPMPLRRKQHETIAHTTAFTGYSFVFNSSCFFWLWSRSSSNCLRKGSPICCVVTCIKKNMAEQKGFHKQCQKILISPGKRSAEWVREIKNERKKNSKQNQKNSSALVLKSYVLQPSHEGLIIISGELPSLLYDFPTRVLQIIPNLCQETFLLQHHAFFINAAECSESLSQKDTNREEGIMKEKKKGTKFIKWSKD